jgi:sugar (pentulose or hexulose) kinase
MAADHILAIDVGTQSVRALIFNPTGDLIAKKQIHIEPYFSAHPGWAEQHTAVFWDAIGQACQGILDGVGKDAIAAAVLTTQRATVVNVDAQGQPLRPAISWLDQRVATDLPPINRLWRLAFMLARANGTVNYLQSNAECNWIAQHQPDVQANTYKYLLLSGYLTYKLTGNFADSVAAQVGFIPFDHKTQAWHNTSDWRWQALRVEPEQMPDLIPPGDRLGAITPEAAAHTGLPQGLPLISAGADKACEILGSGCVEPHMGALSYGTTATINSTHTRYIEVIPLLPAYPAALPGHYSLEVQIYRGYWLVNWFKQEFGHREVRIAAERGIAPESLFDDLVWAVPPGAEGLVLQPYWNPGVRVPGPEAKGSIIGFSDVHTRAHIYRAILEGIAYALREATERTVKRSGVPITELRVSGGGSQSDAAMQLTADIFNLPAMRPHTYETSGLGAAINGMVGMGIHADYARAVDAMVHTGAVFQPDAATHAIYDDLYQQVYKQMYKRLRPLYRAMKGINTQNKTNH